MLFDQQNRFHFIIFLSVLLALIIATSAEAKKKSTNQPHPQHITLNKPLFSDSSITRWANAMVARTFTYNYQNYKQILEDNSVYYTADCWDNFMKALKMSGHLDAVVNKKLAVSAVTNNSLKMIQGAVEDGRYTWHVKVPTNIIYFRNNKQQMKPQPVLVDLTIIRTSDKTDGIVIKQFQVTPGR